MAASLLGLDIGSNSIKLALVSKGEVTHTALVSVPDDLMEHGNIVSIPLFSELLRNTLKHEGIHAFHAAVTLPHEAVLNRHVLMPTASEEEARYKLRTALSDGKNADYIYDFLLLDSPEDSAGDKSEVLASRTSLSLIEDTRSALRGAGLRLVKASPPVCSYISLIRAIQYGEGASYLEYCVADFGCQAVRLYMFRNDRHIIDYTIRSKRPNPDYNNESGVEALTEILAHTVEKYRTAHPHSPMSHVWLCGGGAASSLLQSKIADRLDMRIHSAEELLTKPVSTKNFCLYAQAAGIALFRSGREPK